MVSRSTPASPREQRFTVCRCCSAVCLYTFQSTSAARPFLLPPTPSTALPRDCFPCTSPAPLATTTTTLMSSKRGRKRNDNLPPNRARDVQRAFRARRAAHLEASTVPSRCTPTPLTLALRPAQALENRVAELEDENNMLRAALNLPPANRPPLGKGPTGKDKPKPYSPRSQPPAIVTADAAASTSALTTNGLPPLSALPLAPASRTDSPSSTSTRTHSMSPSSLSASLNAVAPPPPPVVPVDPWEEGLFNTGRERAEIQPSPVTTSYPATPLSATGSQSYQFPNPAARVQQLSQQYSMQPGAQNFSHTQERPLADAFADTNSLFDRRFQYPFQPAPDSSHTPLHAQSPTSPVSMPPQRGTPTQQIQPPVNYAHKRSITEPNALRSLLLNQVPPSLSHLQQQQQNAQQPRGPSPTSLSDGIPMLRAADFDMDPRGGRMPSLPS